MNPPAAPPGTAYTWTWRVVAAAMCLVGVLHFLNPTPFVRIVPSALPWPYALVILSGVAEVLLGVGLVPLRTRRLAAYGLVALYLAVFPANINMAVNHIALDPAHPSPEWIAWVRLPFQALFIGVAVWIARRTPRPA